MPGLAPGLFLIEESMENQATAVVENPYGLTALWSQGDIVARSTLIILAIMSRRTESTDDFAVICMMRLWK